MRACLSPVEAATIEPKKLSSSLGVSSMFGPDSKGHPGLNQTISFLPGRVFSYCTNEFRVLSDISKRFRGAPESLRRIHNAQPGCVLVVECRQSISIARGSLLDLRSRIGEDNQRSWQREFAAILQ